MRFTSSSTAISRTCNRRSVRSLHSMGHTPWLSARRPRGASAYHGEDRADGGDSFEVKRLGPRNDVDDQHPCRPAVTPHRWSKWQALHSSRKKRW
jgi:hypothetical protein